MAEDSSFIWLRPATECEVFFNNANKKGTFVTVYGLTLCSAEPLSEDHVKEALLHTFRKIPSLRMCFRERDGTLWACDMNREQLDFKATDKQELVPLVETLIQYRFPTTEGPLWCARLLPPDAIVPNGEPELGTDFPHSRTLLLVNHHGIADGTTNMFIANAFLRVLDDVIAGTSVDDKAQLGRLAAGEETKAITDARVAELMKDKGHFKNVLDEAKQLCREMKLIPRTYPLPRDPNYKAQVVLRNLDKETTQSFIKRCKKEGITVNSGLTAVLNASLTDFLREGGLEQEVYHIHELHSVNMRRYWLEDTSGALGVHMMLMKNMVSTPARWSDNFWDYARNVHKSIWQELKENGAVTFLINLLHGGDPDTFFEERPTPQCDYGVANMGDAHRHISEEGRQVRLGHIFRVTSCWNDPMYHFFHTLHSRLTYGLTYGSDFLTRENAHNLVDKMFENLRAVTQC